MLFLRPKINPLFFFSFFLLFFSSVFGYPLPKNNVSIFFTPATAEDKNSAYVRLTNFIDQAEKSIYGALHELDLISVAELLKKKSAQGVYIELLLEERWLEELDNIAAYEILKSAPNIKVTPDYRKSGLMHNKYIIVDKKYVWTGSANWTFNGFFRNYNDGLIIGNTEIAKEYYKNYLHLSNPYFKKRLNKNIYPKVIDLDNQQKITPVFSRFGYSVTERLNKEIRAIKKEVKFLIFAFSSQPISQQLITELNAGSEIKGIFDNSFESENILENWKYVPFQTLWQAGADIKYDNEKAKLHHKAFILDNRKIITGSFNFSKNAEKNNNENLIVLESKKINAIYQNRFKNLWERFPDETEFETYTKLKNNQKTDLSFLAYRKKKFKENYRLLNKEINGDFFTAKVINITSSSQLVVQLPQSKKTIPIRLYGCLSPFRGNHKLHQEPQFTFTRQKVALPLIQKNIFFKYLYKHEDEYICIAFLKKENLSKYEKTLNAKYLHKGFALWNRKDEKHIENLAKDTSYQNNLSPQKWEMLVSTLKTNSSSAKNKKRGLHSKALRLKKHPRKAEQEWENAKIKIATLENRHSLTVYQKRCYIGNRKTLKCYPPSHSNYLNYLKDLDDPKLIFFATKEDARMCGYKLMP